MTVLSEASNTPYKYNGYPVKRQKACKNIPTIPANANDQSEKHTRYRPNREKLTNSLCNLTTKNRRATYHIYNNQLPGYQTYITKSTTINSEDTPMHFVCETNYHAGPLAHKYQNRRVLTSPSKADSPQIVDLRYLSSEFIVNQVLHQRLHLVVW